MKSCYLPIIKMNNILETILKLILGVICSFFVFFGFIFCFDSPDTFTNIALLVGYLAILWGIYRIPKIRNYHPIHD